MPASPPRPDLTPLPAASASWQTQSGPPRPRWRVIGSLGEPQIFTASLLCSAVVCPQSWGRKGGDGLGPQQELRCARHFFLFKNITRYYHSYFTDKTVKAQKRLGGLLLNVTRLVREREKKINKKNVLDSHSNWGDIQGERAWH